MGIDQLKNQSKSWIRRKAEDRPLTYTAIVAGVACLLGALIF